MLNRLTANLDFQGEALVLRAERQRQIASNIANADTPGYVARDFDFSAALREATSRLAPGGGGATRPAVPGAALMTVSNELGAQVAGDLLGEAFGRGSRVPPTLRYATAAQTNLDSNSVDMDRERASFADNALKYEATLRFINGGVRTLQDAMRSHTQG